MFKILHHFEHTFVNMRSRKAMGISRRRDIGRIPMLRAHEMRLEIILSAKTPPKFPSESLR